MQEVTHRNYIGGPDEKYRWCIMQAQTRVIQAIRKRQSADFLERVANRKEEEKELLVPHEGDTEAVLHDTLQLLYALRKLMGNPDITPFSRAYHVLCIDQLVEPLEKLQPKSD
jgi:predicted RNA polymerase sigma factor